MISVEGERTALLGRVVKIFALVGLLAYVPSLIASLAANLPAVAVLDTAAYAVVIVVAFMPRLSSRLQLWSIIGSMFVVGVVVLVMTGPFGAGLLWIMCAVVISALFGNIRVMAVTIGLSLAAFSGYSLLTRINVLHPPVSPLSFVVIASNMIAISLALGYVIHASFGGMERAVVAQEILSKELHHRVKNNLQVTLSLIALEAYGSAPTPSIVALERRVRVLTVVNELFLARPDTLRMDVRALARGVAGCAPQWTIVSDDGLEGNERAESFEMDSADAAHFAIGVGELLNLMAPDTVLICSMPRSPLAPPRIRLRLEAGAKADRIPKIQKIITEDGSVNSLLAPLTFRVLGEDAEGGPGFELDAVE